MEVNVGCEESDRSLPVTQAQRMLQVLHTRQLNSPTTLRPFFSSYLQDDSALHIPRRLKTKG
ncbi:hypothetical protein BYT27DRAFT_7180092 [Phlegmacium glaucopus]|nr:hypothetical protein BYT27DRAFT_7180092 [Phlegmacium glaucopus]